VTGGEHDALSVLFGVAPAAKVPGILSALKSLWARLGAVLRHHL
jgi:hypothetical protein